MLSELGVTTYDKDAEASRSCQVPGGEGTCDCDGEQTWPEAPPDCQAPLMPCPVTSAVITSGAPQELVTIVFCRTAQKPKARAGKMAQKMKVLAAKPDHRSSIPGPAVQDEKEKTDSCSLPLAATLYAMP